MAKKAGTLTDGDGVTHIAIWNKETADTRPLCGYAEWCSWGNYEKVVDCPKCLEQQETK